MTRWLVQKKPVQVETIRFDGSNHYEIMEWMGVQGAAGLTVVPDLFTIQTLEGLMAAGPGDWIIRGVKGEFYPCKPDIFEQTYEPVREL
jgi:hypothetical protein